MWLECRQYREREVGGNWESKNERNERQKKNVKLRDTMEGRKGGTRNTGLWRDGGEESGGMQCLNRERMSNEEDNREKDEK